jgi:RimJ/RimL family protein N-acetyltransferase
MKIIPLLLFETPRLRLVAARPEHAVSVFEEYTGRDDASRYLQRRSHASPDRTLAVIEAWGEKSWRENNRFVWTICRTDGQAIGLFLMFVESDVAEIHYGIGPSWWGQGFVTEAGNAVMDWVVGASDLSEVTTCCAAEHAASLRVLEKIGLQRIERLPAYLYLSATDQKVDAWVYRWKRPVIREITKDDAQAVVELWRSTWTATYSQSLGSDVLAGMLADLEAHETGSMLPETGERGYCVASEGVIQGSVIIAERGKAAYLWGLYILPECQRHGLGSQLLAAAIGILRQAERVEIRVLESSLPAQAFYQKHGFREVGKETSELLGSATVEMIVMEAQVGTLKAQLERKRHGQHVIIEAVS